MTLRGRCFGTIRLFACFLGTVAGTLSGAATPGPGSVGLATVPPDDAGAIASAITCDVLPGREIWHVGDRPLLQVRLHNRGDAAVHLVGAVNGAEFERYPRVYFTVEGPPLERKIEGGCGDVTPIRIHDFIEVLPGDSFDPYMVDGTRFFFPSQTLHRSRFGASGTYIFTFHYDSHPPPSPPGPLWVVEPDAVTMLEQLPRVRLSCSARIIVE